jgi:acyl carrier protein
MSEISKEALSRADILRILSELLTHELGVDAGSIELQADLVDDLYLDSLGLVQLTLLMSETFEIEIEPEHLGEFRTLGQTVSVIERLLGRGHHV